MTALADLHGLPWRFHAQPPCPDKTSRGLGPHTHQHLLLMPAISTHHTLFIAFPKQSDKKWRLPTIPPSTGHKETHEGSSTICSHQRHWPSRRDCAKPWRMLGIPGDGRGWAGMCTGIHGRPMEHPCCGNRQPDRHRAIHLHIWPCMPPGIHGSCLDHCRRTGLRPPGTATGKQQHALATSSGGSCRACIHPADVGAIGNDLHAQHLRQPDAGREKPGPGAGYGPRPVC